MENNIFHRWGLRILIELLLQFSKSSEEQRYALLNLLSDAWWFLVGRMFIGIIQRLQVLGYIYHNSESDEETH